MSATASKPALTHDTIRAYAREARDHVLQAHELLIQYLPSDLDAMIDVPSMNDEAANKLIEDYRSARSTLLEALTELHVALGWLKPMIRCADQGGEEVARIVHVTKAWDEKAKELTVPKTVNGVRDVPIEPELVPLLEHLRKSVADLSILVAPLLPLHDEQRRAKILRDHLADAKVDRARLTENTASTSPIIFRSCRDSGITWLALAGIDLAKIQRRAGHDDISTTLGYVKSAEDLSGKVGAPFGPLPAGLLAQPGVLPRRKSHLVVPKEGVEPPT